MTQPTYDEKLFRSRLRSSLAALELNQMSPTSENGVDLLVELLKQAYLDGWCAYGVDVGRRIHDLETNGRIDHDQAQYLEGA